ncbi:MAG: hypothetical protein ABSE49_09435 [Polyangiaceae bacterium]
MPMGFWVVSLISQVAIVPLVAAWLRRSAAASTASAVRLMLVLFAWQGTVIALGSAGVFAPRPGASPAIGLAVVLPIVAGVVALRRWDRGLPEASLATLMGLQVMRIVGFEFVVAGRGGLLPLVFAAPAGWGDAFIGVTAPLVALAVARRSAGWRTIAIAWNVLGIADLVDAVFLGITSSPGALRLFDGPLSTEPMTRLPLSLIPTFGVPLAVLGHIAALRALRAMAARRTPAPATLPAAG